MDISYKVNWRPLEDFSSKYPNEINCGDFMYIGSVSIGITEILINLYKHINTRRYINICDDGRLWRYSEGEYIPTGNVRGEIERVNN